MPLKSVLFLTLALLSLPAPPAHAATISGKNITVTLTAADFGLAAAQPHTSWSGTSTLDGGDVSGTTISLTDGTTTITKTGLLFWTYSDTNKSRNITATYTITRPTLAKSGVSTTVSNVTVTSITTSSITYSSSSKLYSGYANMTLDLSGTSRSGTYTSTGTTVTITVTII